MWYFLVPWFCYCALGVPAHPPRKIYSETKAACETSRRYTAPESPECVFESK